MGIQPAVPPPLPQAAAPRRLPAEPRSQVVVVVMGLLAVLLVIGGFALAERSIPSIGRAIGPTYRAGSAAVSKQGRGFHLGVVEFPFEGMPAQAEAWEVGGRIEVDLVLRQASPGPLHWIEFVPGCSWSHGDDQAAVRRHPLPQEDEEWSVLMSVGCSWFEDPRPPTVDELDAWVWRPGEERRLEYRFEPEDWLDSDAEGGAEETVWTSWSFLRDTAKPRDRPPRLHPDGWDEVRFRFSWDEDEGFRLQVG